MERLFDGNSIYNLKSGNNIYIYIYAKYNQTLPQYKLKKAKISFVSHGKQVIDSKHCNMFVQVYLLLSLTVVLAQREKVIVGVFQADDTLPFGIHRSGPAVDLGVQKLKDFIGKDMDVEIIDYLSLQGSECDPTQRGLFGKIAAEMHHLKKHYSNRRTK